MSKLGTVFITLMVSTLRATESLRMLDAALRGKRYQVVTGQDGVTRVHVV